MFRVLFSLCLVFTPPALSILPEEAYMNFIQLVHRDGPEYSVERHTALTDDGYTLDVHRMNMDTSRNRRNSHNRRIPVFLMHGVLGSGEDFIRMGKTNSLGYLLANENLDVWFGNYRGTEYSSHTTYTKRDKKFWNYGFDEVGEHDLPAMIDMILNKTNCSRLHYVGYSMGSMGFLVMANRRPDMMEKIASFTSLAPLIYSSPVYRENSKITLDSRVLDTLENLGMYQIGMNDFTRNLLVDMCRADSESNDVCLGFTNKIYGEDYEQVIWEKYPVIFAKIQDSSIKLIKHFMQQAVIEQTARPWNGLSDEVTSSQSIQIFKGVLANFDYGKKQNMYLYGKSTPTKYNIEAINVPTDIFYGQNDLLATPKEIVKFGNKLKRTNRKVTMHKIPYNKFSHIDFLYAKDLNRLANNLILKSIMRFTKMYTTY